MKRKKAHHLLRRLDRLESQIDDVWCDARSDRLADCRDALDLAIFQIGVAKAELIKQASRK